MKKILKVFLKQPTEVEAFNRGMTQKPIAQWKKNVFGLFTGSIIGLYLGQYFPDIYYHEIAGYLPEFKQLEIVAEATQHRKPDPVPPRSLFDYPEELLIMMGKRPQVPEGTYIVKNDVTNEQ